MISVVMATYNGGKYIERQLTTLLEQTRRPDEVIICDDVSTDNTAQLVQKFIKEHSLSDKWHFSINEKNLGYRKNFAQALAKATGNYIFLADQDDEWHADKLAKMTALMQQKPEIKALNCAVQLIDANGKPLNLPENKAFYNAGFIYSKTPLAKLTEFNANAIMRNNISPGCTMLIRSGLRDILVEEYQAEMPHDWYLNLMAALDHGCYFLNEELIGYRIHENNTLGASTDTRWQKVLAKFDVSEKIAEQEDNLCALDNLVQALKLTDAPEVLYLEEYYGTRLAYYKHPSLKTLAKLKRYPEYRADSKLRGRLWDYALALHLEKMIARIATK